MCISAATMNEIESTLSQFDKLNANPLPILKECFPDLSFVRMSASDMDEQPFRSLPNFDLYLLDGRDHCVQLTDDLGLATAVVVAQK